MSSSKAVPATNNYQYQTSPVPSPTSYSNPFPSPTDSSNPFVTPAADLNPFVASPTPDVQYQNPFQNLR